MDPQTDNLLHENLFKFSEGKNLIVVTHRLENIDRFDRVIVMDNGKIAEIGKYQDLKRNQTSFFNNYNK